MPAAPDGNPEGIAVDRRSGRFFVSRIATGAIFAGTLGSRALQPFTRGPAESRPDRSSGRDRPEDDRGTADVNGGDGLLKDRARLLVVNASFTAGPTAEGNLTVPGLARNAVRHVRHGRRGP